MKIGIDVDGVLASFEEGYAKLIIAVTGKDLFPEPKPWWPTGCPPVWFWTQHFGYTQAEDSATWKAIKESPDFWQKLKILPGAYTLRNLFQKYGFLKSHDIYFVTNRLGIRPKEQTERWLREHLGLSRPTVLLSEEKGLIAKGLHLDCYIDDKDSNVLDVAKNAVWAKLGAEGPVIYRTRTYCLNKDYNKGMPESNSATPYTRVDSVEEFLQLEGLL